MSRARSYPRRGAIHEIRAVSPVAPTPPVCSPASKPRSPAISWLTALAWPPVFLLAAALGLGALACSGTDDTVSDESPSKPVSVEVVEVVPEDLSLEVALTGQLEAEFDVVVHSEVDGVIETIHFDEGQPVAKGDVLFRLRDGEQRARVKEARAALSLAQDVYDRTQRLTSQDISAIARRSEAVAELDEANARLDLAQLDLDRTALRAPFDGVAGTYLVGPGERIEPDIGLVSIAAIDKLQLVYTVPEPSIALAKVGSDIHIRVVAFSGERFPGHVFFVSPTVDRATRRLIAKAWIPNEDRRLKPGMFANVDIRVFDKPDSLLVPEAAMVYDRNGTYVWRVGEGDLAEKIPVEIGIRQDGRVEILSGIEPHDRIVSAGVNKVKAGKQIAVVPPAAVPAHARDRSNTEDAGDEGAPG